MLNGSGRFALLSRDFKQIFGQIVSIRIKTLGNTNMVASRLIERGKGSLPVDVRRSKTSLLKLPIVSILFTSVKFTCGPTLKLRHCGNPPLSEYIMPRGSEHDDS